MTSQELVESQRQSPFPDEQHVATEQHDTQTEKKPYLCCDLEFGEQTLQRLAQIPYDILFDDSFLDSNQPPSFSLLNTSQLARPDNTYIRDEDSIGDILDEVSDILPEDPMASWLADTPHAKDVSSEFVCSNEEQDSNTNPMYVNANSLLKKTPISKKFWLKVKKQRDLERVAERFKHLPPQSPFNVRRPLQIIKTLRDDSPVVGSADLERVVADGIDLSGETDRDNIENTHIHDVNNSDSQNNNSKQHNSSCTALNTTDSNISNVESSWYTSRKDEITKKSPTSTNEKKVDTCSNDPSVKRVSFASNEAVQINDSQYLASEDSSEDDNDRKRKQEHRSNKRKAVPSILYDSEDTDASLDEDEKLHGKAKRRKTTRLEEDRSFILGSNNLLDKADNSITTDTTQLTTELNANNNMDEEKLMTLRIMRRLRDEAKVTGMEVLHALIACSGHVGLTRKYLRYGQEACKKYSWTMEEDRILVGGAGTEAVNTLRKQRGIDNVNRRIIFLELLTRSVERV